MENFFGIELQTRITSLQCLSGNSIIRSLRIKQQWVEAEDLVAGEGAEVEAVEEEEDVEEVVRKVLAEPDLTLEQNPLLSSLLIRTTPHLDLPIHLITFVQTYNEGRQ
jgi:hypothetical protein